jgi:DNA-binding beta-propeller fold protein YncE
VLAGLGLVVTGLLLAGGLWSYMALSTPAVALAPVGSQTTRFDGRYLLAVSDADMVGTAYADGVLRQIPGDVDTLTIIPLPVRDATASTVEVPVSNSVTSWPQVIAVAPEGETIYVVETAGPVDDAVTELATADLPAGRLLSVIDISGGADRARVTTVDLGESPAHLAVSPDGAYLAVGLREEGRQLAVLPTATLHNPSSFRFFALARSDGQPSEEVTAVAWHPSGAFLAVGNDRRELQFYRVSHGADGAAMLSPHGERLQLGNTITYGQFTRDGGYYLTAEINWEAVPRPLGNLVNPPGEMIAVRFDPAESAAHSVAARVAVGLSPEGFAVSPQEDLIVTVDMRRTYLPDGLATVIPGSDLNSLTLLSFDKTTGALRVLGDPYGFEGVLPEHAAFDADGDALGVVVYNKREQPLEPGYIEFWNVVREGDEPRLERTAVRLPVVRGPHAMALIP